MMPRAALRILFLCFWLPVMLTGEEYPLGPDFEPQAGVPTGRVTRHVWTSRIFPGSSTRLLGLCTGAVHSRQACRGDGLSRRAPLRQ